MVFERKQVTEEMSAKSSDSYVMLRVTDSYVCSVAITDKTVIRHRIPACQVQKYPSALQHYVEQWFSNFLAYGPKNNSSSNL